ncbi:hypothetical protein [Desulfovibrio sp. TomC]|uniref:hypothetical protein n=1 Tax=Desulfovibrio sp. TomC TaxID=1562888 RepID=UPI000573494F|nr:hypothetical protein [Desulfovibrio sp. TomC]KHK02890.1 hypothetical protein NY78_1840 [Desulfovibrio sp. TomC]
MTEFADIARRCDAIEECYEFMLAYAAQGLADDRDSRSGTQLRELLTRAVNAACGLPAAYGAATQALELAPRQRYQDFLDVLRADTAKALAAMELVLAQPRISSQLIDNLNASLHVRTLLTDVFLLDEILGIQQALRGPAASIPDHQPA